MAEISEAAKDVCARWFGMSPRDTLRSHPPHAVLAGVRQEMDELVAAGIVTEAPFNAHGSLLFTGSEAAHGIGRRRQVERLMAMEGTSAPART